MKPRLFIVENDGAILETFQIALPRLLDCEIAGIARSGAEALKKIPQSRPQVLWVDVCMEPMDGPGLLRLLRSRSDHIRTVFFTGLECERRIREAITAEPEGFVHKTDEINCWREAFQAVMCGAHYVSARIAAIKKKAPVAELSCLSNVERVVLSLVVRGQSKDQIAAELGISPHTARHHREHLMSKLGVNCIESLCVIACRSGLIDCANPTGTRPGS